MTFIALLAGCFFAGNLAAQDQKNGLIAYWNFDQSPDGNLSNPLVQSAGVSFDADTLRERAVQFTEAGAYLMYEHGLDLFNYFSIACWIKPSKSDETQTIFQQKFKKRQFTIQIKKQDLSVVLCDGANKASRIGLRYNFKPGHWALVCLVMEGVYANIYVDGKRVFRSDQLLLNIRDKQTGDSLLLGNDTQRRTTFRGAIDEVAVYERAITEDEIRQLYEKDFPQFAQETSAEPEPARDAIYNRNIEVQKQMAVNNKKLTFQFWDDGQEDDDRITLIFNDQKILEDYTLKKNEKEERIVEVRPGLNKLILIAENLGKIPPNTAVVIVYDGDKKTKLELKSDLCKSGAVEFVYENK
jgi:hypothetical protein